MPSVTALLRSLGNYGALANVRGALEECQREDWLVASLVLRLNEDERGRAAMTPAAGAAEIA